MNSRKHYNKKKLSEIVTAILPELFLFGYGCQKFLKMNKKIIFDTSEIKMQNALSESKK